MIPVPKFWAGFRPVWPAIPLGRHSARTTCEKSFKSRVLCNTYHMTLNMADRARGVQGFQYPSIYPYRNVHSAVHRCQPKAAGKYIILSHMTFSHPSHREGYGGYRSTNNKYHLIHGVGTSSGYPALHGGRVSQD